MKSLSRSNATVDTHPSAPHNCPSCRCRSTDILKLKHTVSQPYLSHRQQEPNLYLSNHLSEPASEQPSRPFLSGIFHQPPQRITFNYAAAVSPKQTNISFSYTSPPKSRKPNSLDSKFNTRKFKNMHFPLISLEDDTVPVRKIIRGKDQTITRGKDEIIRGKEDSKGRNSPYYEVFTGEKTPQKHRILKMKKERSKQRLEITLSKRSSSNSLEHAGIPQSQEGNQYQLGPKNTPINALWLATSEQTQKSIKQEDLQRLLNREILPASIEHIQTHPSRQEFRLSSPSPDLSQQKLPLALPSPSRQANLHRKYPTIESLNTYEARGCVGSVSEQVRGQVSEEETSLRFAHQSEGEEWSQAQLARSISEELSLHYDYYYPQEESDRSLSLHLAL